MENHGQAPDGLANWVDYCDELRIQAILRVPARNNSWPINPAARDAGSPTQLPKPSTAGSLFPFGWTPAVRDREVS